jgi:hypothetical protein
VWREGDDLYAIVRGVNYRLGSWTPAVIRTHNVLTRLDASRAIVDQRALVEVPGLPPAVETQVRGYEDCRLFRWRGRWHATATVRDRDPSARCQIALLALDDEWRIASLAVLRGHDDALDQKNWMPAVDGDDLFVVYLCDPTTVLRVDPVTHLVAPCAYVALALENQRGGSHVCAGGSACSRRARRLAAAILHRFLHFDRAFRIVALMRFRRAITKSSSPRPRLRPARGHARRELRCKTSGRSSPRSGASVRRWPCVVRRRRSIAMSDLPFR